VAVTVYYVSTDGIWTFNGQKAIHGNNTAYNHYMTTNAATGIYNATTFYQATYPGLVTANDMSLPYGGKFDINANWQSPHYAHDFGTAADIDYITGAVNVAAFLASCSYFGAIYTKQEDNGSLHCHWSN
jgi:hypothetical protein